MPSTSLPADSHHRPVVLRRERATIFLGILIDAAAVILVNVALGYEEMFAPFSLVSLWVASRIARNGFISRHYRNLETPEVRRLSRFVVVEWSIIGFSIRLAVALGQLPFDEWAGCVGAFSIAYPIICFLNFAVVRWGLAKVSEEDLRAMLPERFHLRSGTFAEGLRSGPLLPSESRAAGTLSDSSKS